jgi:ribonuclease E
MTKHMLIDATHPEETRVVVVDGQRLEEFDVETAQKKPLKGNIYLAKVVRVEPSLQAAFVDYGGNRHGFLAFNEIHPDYYRIPIADREALLAEEAEAFSEQAEREERAANRRRGSRHGGQPAGGDNAEPVEAGGDASDEAGAGGDESDAGYDRPDEGERGDENRDDGDEHDSDEHDSDDHDEEGEDEEGEDEEGEDGEEGGEAPRTMSGLEPDTGSDDDASGDSGERLADAIDRDGPAHESDRDEDRDGDEAEHHEPFGKNDSDEPHDHDDAAEDEHEDDSLDEAPAMPLRRDGGDPVLAKSGDSITDLVPPSDSGQIDDIAPAKQAIPIETVGGDEIDEAKLRRRHLHRRYKIQEVIKRRQIMLVQVTKEERGTKGAALTTYLSLAGRYCVLMPNTGRGGGISRKISNPGDRKRLKSVLDELGIPDGMSVIVRTAGSERTKAEIRRDCDYLLRLWDGIREQTLKSTAPALIHEEANLIKRSIRDLYARDIDDVIVEGDEGYKAAKSFMKMLMPSHAKRVQQYKDAKIPVFQRYHVESQLDAIHSPVVQLKSGGYVVLNQTEALVAIDVNSGRATRERHIEETALKTNLEAASEIARQLRLRDLAGLIVIDFIDMEEQRHNNAVERKLKEAMRQDRARIQIGRISPFGLLELSRQRLRPSLVEASTEVCKFCRGMGHVRSIESTALHMLRSLEEEAVRKPAPGFSVSAPVAVSLYILNQKRRALAEIEVRHGVRIYINGDDKLIRPDFELERMKELLPGELPPAAPMPSAAVVEVEEEDEVEIEAETDAADDRESDEVEERQEPREGRGRRRRGRRRGRGGERDERRQDERGQQRRDDRQHDDPTDDQPQPMAASSGEEPGGDAAGENDQDAAANAAGDQGDGNHPRRRRRRGRRGGRRRRGRSREQDGSPETQHADRDEHEPHERSEPHAPQHPPRPAVPSPADFRFAGDADVGSDDEAELDEQAAARANAAMGAHRPHHDEDRFDDEPQREVAQRDVPAPDHERSDATDDDQPRTGEANADNGTPPSPEPAPAGPRRGGWWQRRGFGS